MKQNLVFLFCVVGLSLGKALPRTKGKQQNETMVFVVFLFVGLFWGKQTTRTTTTITKQHEQNNKQKQIKKKNNNNNNNKTPT